MAHRFSLTELLRKARERSITHLLLRHLVLCAAITLGAAAIVLLFGTDSVGWAWLVLVAVGSLGVALFRARKLFPSAYLVAQWIDARLRLTDTLSTAAFFLESPGSADAAVRETQRRQAEKLAETVDLKQALPMARPRALYPAVALALAVAGIFLLRYAILGSFDPRTPLAQSAFDNIFRPATQQAKAVSPENGGQTDDGSAEDKDSARNNDYAGDPTADPNANFADRPKEENGQQSGKKEQQSDGLEKQDSPPGNDQADKNDNKQGDQPADGNQTARNKQDPSLLNKLREALNDMLNKMKSSPNDNAKNQKGEQNDSEAQNIPDGQAQDQSESQQSKSGKQSSDDQNGSSSAQNKPSQEEQNGIGSQEGDKAAKQAEALKAMGKITELLGKRAEGVKGNVMVEVGTTRQQLKTRVTESQAAHGEAGSEIHRDEVPPIYEQFVQQYFENIRKPSPAGKPDPANATK